MKTFTCRFGTEVACTIQVADELPLPGTSHVLKVEWTGKPTPRVFRPYVAWMNSVNQQLADQWDADLMHVFLLSPDETEAWSYTPGGKPQLV